MPYFATWDPLNEMEAFVEQRMVLPHRLTHSGHTHTWHCLALRSVLLSKPTRCSLCTPHRKYSPHITTYLTSLLTQHTSHHYTHSLHRLPGICASKQPCQSERESRDKRASSRWDHTQGPGEICHSHCLTASSYLSLPHSLTASSYLSLPHCLLSCAVSHCLALCENHTASDNGLDGCRVCLWLSAIRLWLQRECWNSSRSNILPAPHHRAWLWTMQ